MSLLNDLMLLEGQESFITDFGAKINAKSKSGTMNIGRYGVWKFNPSKGSHQVIDTGDDLEELQKKHGDLQVVKIGKGKAGALLPMQRRAM